MTDKELLKALNFVVTHSFIPDDPSFFETFNYNTNQTLKTDFMEYIFSNIPDNTNNMFDLSVKNNLSFRFDDFTIIYQLLTWCVYQNAYNYFRYIINNKSINLINTTLPYQIYEVLRSYSNNNGGNLLTSITEARILDKYNIKNKLKYLFNL